MMGSDSGALEGHEETLADTAERTEQESPLPDALGELVQPGDGIRSEGCASMIGCLDVGTSRWKQWVEAQLAAGKDPFGPHETASNCVGFCFNAIVESVDADNRRLARVVMIGKKGRRTPAVVERTRLLSSSRIPEAEGEPVRFACFDRLLDEDGLRFESCSQMAVRE